MVATALPEASTVRRLFGRLRPRRALVVMAHPDDCEFACGGTVAALCADGWAVDILVATSGNKGTKDRTTTAQQLGAVREEEQRRAGAILGAEDVSFLGFHDGELRNDDELRGLIVRELRRRRPTLAITWDGYRAGFNHRDHRRVGRATYDAIYPAADDPLFYPEHHEKEGLLPHRPRVLLLAGTDTPDVRIDIAPVLETKVRAVLAHESQIGQRTPEQLMAMWRERAQAMARERGVEDNGPAFTEAYRRVQWG